MRILSLLPSATEIVCELGLREALVGITHECDHPAGIEREIPVVIESCLGPEGKALPPGEIDRRIRETLERGEGVYRFKAGMLEALRPDLVITQGLCDVCAVPAQAVSAAVKSLAHSPRILSLDPTHVGGIFENIVEVGEACGKSREAQRLVQRLKERVEGVREKTAPMLDAQRPGVACLEWLDPLFTAGHWVPELVEWAGGRDVLAQAGVPSQRVEWEAVCTSAPEVIVVMPCGYDVEKARAELPLLTSQPGWKDLPAVRANRVHVVDANSTFSRPGPRIVDGLEHLARLLHPS